MRYGTTIYTETVTKVSLLERPFKVREALIWDTAPGVQQIKAGLCDTAFIEPMHVIPEGA